MERSEEGFEQDLQGLGAEYQRMWTVDPDPLLQRLEAQLRAQGRRVPGRGWWVAASALVLILAFGGGLLQRWTAVRSALTSVKLTYIPPKTRTTIVYAISSRFQERTGGGTSGVQATNLILRSQEELKEVITPNSGGGYKLTLRYEHATSQLGSGKPQPDTALAGAVVTYLVGASGQVLSAQVVPAADKGMLYTGKSVSSPLSQPVPDKLMKPGQTWTIDRTVTAGGTTLTVPARYTYEGSVNGYLKVHFAAEITVAKDSLGQSGREIVAGDIYLDPRSHLLERMTERSTFSGTQTTPAKGSKPASTVPDHSASQMSWRRVH